MTKEQIIAEVKAGLIKKIKEELETFDYYCEDDDCCYRDVVNGVSEKLKEME